MRFKNLCSKNIYEQCLIETDGASWNAYFNLETLHPLTAITQICLGSVHRSLDEIAQAIVTLTNQAYLRVFHKALIQ